MGLCSVMNSSVEMLGFASRVCPYVATIFTIFWKILKFQAKN